MATAPAHIAEGTQALRRRLRHIRGVHIFNPLVPDGKEISNGSELPEDFWFLYSLHWRPADAQPSSPWHHLHTSEPVRGDLQLAWDKVHTSTHTSRSKVLSCPALTAGASGDTSDGESAGPSTLEASDVVVRLTVLARPAKQHHVAQQAALEQLPDHNSTCPQGPPCREHCATTCSCAACTSRSFRLTAGREGNMQALASGRYPGCDQLKDVPQLSVVPGSSSRPLTSTLQTSPSATDVASNQHTPPQVMQSHNDTGHVSGGAASSVASPSQQNSPPLQLKVVVVEEGGRPVVRCMLSVASPRHTRGDALALARVSSRDDTVSDAASGAPHITNNGFTAEQGAADDLEGHHMCDITVLYLEFGLCDLVAVDEVQLRASWPMPNSVTLELQRGVHCVPRKARVQAGQVIWGQYHPPSRNGKHPDAIVPGNAVNKAGTTSAPVSGGAGQQLVLYPPTTTTSSGQPAPSSFAAPHIQGTRASQAPVTHKQSVQLLPSHILHAVAVERLPSLHPQQSALHAHAHSATLPDVDGVQGRGGVHSTVALSKSQPDLARVGQPQQGGYQRAGRSGGRGGSMSATHADGPALLAPVRLLGKAAGGLLGLAASSAGGGSDVGGEGEDDDGEEGDFWSHQLLGTLQHDYYYQQQLVLQQQQQRRSFGGGASSGRQGGPSGGSAQGGGLSGGSGYGDNSSGYAGDGYTGASPVDGSSLGHNSLGASAQGQGSTGSAGWKDGTQSWHAGSSTPSRGGGGTPPVGSLRGGALFPPAKQGLQHPASPRVSGTSSSTQAGSSGPHHKRSSSASNAPSLLMKSTPLLHHLTDIHRPPSGVATRAVVPPAHHQRAGSALAAVPVGARGSGHSTSSTPRAQQGSVTARKSDVGAQSREGGARSEAGAGVEEALDVEGARVYDIADMQASIRRLVTQQERLGAAHARVTRVRSRLDELLAEREAREAQEAALRAQRAAVAEQAQRGQQASSLLAHLRETCRDTNERMQERVKMLKGMHQAIKVAEGRRVEAVSALEGPQGQGALDALEAEVSARACALVAELAALYALGPLGAPVTPPSGPPPAPHKPNHHHHQHQLPQGQLVPVAAAQNETPVIPHASAEPAPALAQLEPSSTSPVPDFSTANVKDRAPGVQASSAAVTAPAAEDHKEAAPAGPAQASQPAVAAEELPAVPWHKPIIRGQRLSATSAPKSISSKRQSAGGAHKGGRGSASSVAADSPEIAALLALAEVTHPPALDEVLDAGWAGAPGLAAGLDELAAALSLEARRGGSRGTRGTSSQASSEGLSSVILHALEAPTPSEGSMTEAQPGGSAGDATSTRAAAVANTQAWVETHSLPSVPTTTITTTSATTPALPQQGQLQPPAANGKPAAQGLASKLPVNQGMQPKEGWQVQQHYTNGITAVGHASLRPPSLAPSSASLRLRGNNPWLSGGVPRPLVLGLDLPPDLVRRSMEGSVGWDGSYDEAQRVSAALGYVAHMVALMADYLDVPLRYPLRPRLSTSSVQDYTPLPQAPAPQPGLLQRGLARVFGTSLSPFTQHASASVVAASWLLGSTPTGALATNAAAGPTQRAPGSWHAGDGMPGVEQGHAGGSFMGSQPSPYGPHHAQQRGRRQVSVGGTVGPAALRAPGQELPLHYLERDRARFAYATYLLNKDIEQLLNALSVTSCGPGQVLPNLYKLAIAAASAAN